MNIIIIRKECGSHKGGAERYCLSLIKGLKQYNHNVIFMGNYCDDEVKKYAQFIKVENINWGSSISNLSFHTYIQNNLKRYKNYKVYSLARTYPVNIYRVTDPLHIHHININYNHGIKKIWTNISIRHKLLLHLELKTIKTAKRIITISNLDKKLVTKYYNVDPQIIRVIYNGVDQKLFNPKVKIFRNEIRQKLGIDSDITCYLFPSMDFKRKGLDVLLTALSHITFPFVLLVAGSGPIKKYKHKAKELGISDKVLFLGRYKDINKLYGACDLMVLPTTYDPFGNVHLEALACGVPVITTTQAGGSEIVFHNKTGYIMKNYFDVDELVYYLNDFEKQRDIWPLWGNNARESVKKFTIENNIKQTIQVLDDITHG